MTTTRTETDSFGLIEFFDLADDGQCTGMFRILGENRIGNPLRFFKLPVAHRQPCLHQHPEPVGHA